MGHGVINDKWNHVKRVTAPRVVVRHNEFETFKTGVSL